MTHDQLQRADLVLRDTADRVKLLEKQNRELRDRMSNLQTDLTNFRKTLQPLLDEIHQLFSQPNIERELNNLVKDHDLHVRKSPY